MRVWILLQPIWALDECSRNCTASTIGLACARTSMLGAGNVKFVPPVKALQIVRIVTIARSPPQHRWTWLPSTSCLAYLPHPRVTSASLSPLITSLNGLKLYPCATQKHQHSCGHYITLFSAVLACFVSCTATQVANLKVSWWRSSAQLRVSIKHVPRRFTLGLITRLSGRIGPFCRYSAPQLTSSPRLGQIACTH